PVHSSSHYRALPRLHSFPTRRSSDLTAPHTPRRAPSSSELIAAWPRSTQLTAAFLIGAVSAVLTINALSYWRSSKPSELERGARSEEHTSELQSLTNLVCRLLLEKKK